MSFERWALEHLRLPSSLRSRLYHDFSEKEYRKKLAAATRAGDAKEIEFLRESKRADEYFEYESDEIDFTHELVGRARKLRVPLPEYPERDDNENEFWAMSYSYGERYLTAKGIVEVREAIRREERWVFERRAQWIAGLA